MLGSPFPSFFKMDGYSLRLRFPMDRSDTRYLRNIARLLHEDLGTFRADEADREKKALPPSAQALAEHFTPSHFNLFFIFNTVSQPERKKLWKKALDKGLAPSDARALLANFLGLGTWSRVTGPTPHARAYLRRLFETEACCDFRRWRETAHFERSRNNGRVPADFWEWKEKLPLVDRLPPERRLTIEGSLLRDASGFSRRFPEPVRKPEESQVDWEDDFVPF